MEGKPKEMISKWKEFGSQPNDMEGELKEIIRKPKKILIKS
jgi:hypothetical protein